MKLSGTVLKHRNAKQLLQFPPGRGNITPTTQSDGGTISSIQLRLVLVFQGQGGLES